MQTGRHGQRPARTPADPSEPDPGRSESGRPASTTGQALFEGLHAVLAERRGGNHVRRMASHLVRLDHRLELVALADAERAVYFAPLVGEMRRYAFDEHGVADVERSWTDCVDPARWVDARADELAWVHPRYRWLLDGDRSVWRYRRYP